MEAEVNTPPRDTALSLMRPPPREEERRAPRSEVRRMARLWLRLRQAARERAAYEGRRKGEGR
jgi:hypothetical protein